VDDAPERFGVELLITSVISENRAGALLGSSIGRRHWSEWIVTGLGNACFFVGKLLDFDPRGSEPREEKHEGGQQEEGGGRPWANLRCSCPQSYWPG
jgi:hypothetical protein